MSHWNYYRKWIDIFNLKTSRTEEDLEARNKNSASKGTLKIVLSCILYWPHNPGQ